MMGGGDGVWSKAEFVPFIGALGIDIGMDESFAFSLFPFYSVFPWTDWADPDYGYG